MNYHAIPLSQAIWARGSERLVVAGSVLTDHGCKVSLVFEEENPFAAGNRKYAATWSGVDWRGKKRP